MALIKRGLRVQNGAKAAISHTVTHLFNLFLWTFNSYPQKPLKWQSWNWDVISLDFDVKTSSVNKKHFTIPSDLIQPGVDVHVIRHPEVTLLQRIAESPTIATALTVNGGTLGQYLPKLAWFDDYLPRIRSLWWLESLYRWGLDHSRVAKSNMQFWNVWGATLLCRSRRMEKCGIEDYGTFLSSPMKSLRM